MEAGCATCRCYTHPPPQPPASVGIVLFGMCRRFPKAEAKKADEWCFEHKAFPKPPVVKGKKSK